MMRYQPGVSRLFAVLLLATSLSAACADPGKVTTGKDAIARARLFLHSAGWAAQGTAKATAARAGRATQWTITYLVLDDELRQIPEITISVDGASGQVHYAQNATALGGVPRTIRQPITEKTAEAFARQSLNYAGITTKDLVIRSNSLSRARETSPRWSVIFTRMQGGYEFLFDYLSVDLDPRNGKLLGLSVMPPSPPPSNVHAEITREAAAAYARTALDQLKPPVKTTLPYSAQLWIVPPYDGAIRPGASRLAWVITFSEKSPDGRSVLPAAETWIDAEKGTVIYLHAFRAGKTPR